jgi:hypothetical protein
LETGINPTRPGRQKSAYFPLKTEINVTDHWKVKEMWALLCDFGNTNKSYKAWKAKSSLFYYQHYS